MCIITLDLSFTTADTPTSPLYGKFFSNVPDTSSSINIAFFRQVPVVETAFLIQHVSERQQCSSCSLHAVARNVDFSMFKRQPSLRISHVEQYAFVKE